MIWRSVASDADAVKVGVDLDQVRAFFCFGPDVRFTSPVQLSGTRGEALLLHCTVQYCTARLALVTAQDTYHGQ